MGSDIRTALGDAIVWDTLKLPLRGCAARDPTQLWRCRKHKRWEARRLLSLPVGSHFLDVGSHFGDTVLTMAVHARANGRDDINFVAFEPCRRKCKFIRSMIRANGLEGSVRVMNACVGDTRRDVYRIEEKGFDRYDGRVAYGEEKGGEGSGPEEEGGRVVEGGGGGAGGREGARRRRWGRGRVTFYFDGKGEEEDSPSELDDDSGSPEGE